MNKAPEKPDDDRDFMRAEYDFSNAVRSVTPIVLNVSRRSA